MYVQRRSLLGASLSRDKGFFRHRGTCVDPVCQAVVDTMPETGARLVPFAAFAANMPVRFDSFGLTALDEGTRAQRALSQVGQLPYANAHCDQLATYAETGQFYSPQALKAIAAVGLIWLGVVIASRLR